MTFVLATAATAGISVVVLRTKVNLKSQPTSATARVYLYGGTGKEYLVLYERRDVQGRGEKMIQTGAICPITVADVDDSSGIMSFLLCSIIKAESDIACSIWAGIKANNRGQVRHTCLTRLTTTHLTI